MPLPAAARPFRPTARPFSATARQGAVLRYLAWFIEQHGRAPLLKDVCAALGFRNKSAVQRLLVKLEERGHIQRWGNQTRGIALLTHPAVPHAPDGAALYFIPAEQLMQSAAS